MCESRQQYGDTKHSMDSGYNSLTSTPAVKASSGKLAHWPLKGSATKIDEAETRPRRPFPSCPELLCFEKPVDDATIRWFETNAPRMEQLLVEFLKSGRRDLPKSCRPIAIRLSVLGRGEASARPHLVVLAPPKWSKKIEKFFEREDIKELLIPCGELNLVEVVVAPHTEPFLKCLISDMKVLCSADTANDGGPRDTLCGLPIVVNSRRMTFGGIIQILVPGEDEKPEWRLYGLSAGHFLDNDEEESEVEESGDDSDSEVDTGAGGDDRMHSQSTTQPPIPPDVVRDVTCWDWPETMTLGHILDVGPDARGLSSPDLDWSLIHMNYLLPDYLDITSTETREGEYRMAALKAPEPLESSSTPFSTAPYRNVVATTGTRGLQHGRLQKTPARVLLGRSEAFTNAYILRLSCGTVGPGDSGSWVIDPDTSEVLGHIVAKDMLGDAYVISMADIFSDIKSRLNCLEVELPSWGEVYADPRAPRGVFVERTGSSSVGFKISPTDSSLLDSGYMTTANGTPSTPSLNRRVPTLPGIHAVIRAALPQDIGTNTWEEGNSPSNLVNKSGLDHPMAIRGSDLVFCGPEAASKTLTPYLENELSHTSDPDQKTQPKRAEGTTSRMQSLSGSSSSRSILPGNGSSSTGSRPVSSMQYVSPYRSRHTGYTTRVREIPGKHRDIVVIQHNFSGSSRREEYSSMRSSRNSIRSRGSSYYK